MHHTINAKEFSSALLTHYAKHARDLPWRRNKNPYHIWLSEIMLQQTTVATVIPYFETFLKNFPTVQHLADAPLDDVLFHWQGLGYYSRAKNLHKCAQVIVQQHHSNFPQTEKELLTLPGIGPYTAAAIASIAFEKPATVIDGNVERVISRLYKIEDPLPNSRPTIQEYAEALTPNQHAGDYAQAMMDLGATICTPKSPKCLICPVSKFCAAVKQGDPQNYPKKADKKARPERTGNAWIITNESGEIYLQKRPATGLLANLWQVPNSGLPHPENLEFPPENQIGTIRHIFTHFALNLTVHHLPLDQNKLEINDTHRWFTPNSLPPTPTLIKKVLKLLK